MLRFLRGPLLGIIAGAIWFVNTIFWVYFFIVLAVFKFIVPIKFFRLACTNLLDDMASCWMSVNNVMINICLNVKWQVDGDITFKHDDWYLVIANHQSWTDIVVLMQVLNRKIPLLKFFLKKELIFVPLLGFAWWALDYPFMKRYSKSLLQKKPHLKGKDIATTRKACEKFKNIPVSIMNFVEGTRFNAMKHKKSKSTYQHLLAPKAGGIAYALQAMNGQIKYIVDVTIIYPKGSNTLWAFLSGRMNTVKIHLRKISVPDMLVGDYHNDREFRVRFQQWLNELWQEKDLLIERELKHGL